jgi:hypothetical protein
VIGSNKENFDVYVLMNTERHHQKLRFVFMLKVIKNVIYIFSKLVANINKFSEIQYKKCFTQIFAEKNADSTDKKTFISVICALFCANLREIKFARKNRLGGKFPYCNGVTTSSSSGRSIPSFLRCSILGTPFFVHPLRS